MTVPDHLLRHPSRAAIDSIAARLGLRNNPDMQDWEYEVADSTRLSEFLEAYLEPGITDDERFVLMEVILQSLELLGPKFEHHSAWPRVAEALDANAGMHASSLCYWACLDSAEPDHWFFVTRAVRTVLARHAKAFGVSPPALPGE